MPTGKIIYATPSLPLYPLPLPQGLLTQTMLTGLKDYPFF